MGDLFTVNKNIAMPVPGTENNTWGADLNANSWPVIDTAFGGYTQVNVTGIGAGTYVLTPTQYTPPNIEFGGTLGAALVYQVPTAVGGLWSVYNNTSGAGSLTFASGGGGSQVVPQGQRALLISDGYNMQFAQTGGAQSGNPSALVSTSAINGVAATYMRSDAAPAINQGMIPTWTAGHTFQGNIDLQSTLFVQSGGEINASAAGSPVLVTTPSPGDNSNNAASTAFVALSFAALAGPTFTGVPKAPTAAVGTSTTQLATTAFAAGTSSLTSIGYTKLPSGLIIQWGTGAALDTGTTFTFSSIGGIAFPNACFSVIACAYSTQQNVYVASFSATAFIAYNGGSSNIAWVAFGY